MPLLFRLLFAGLVAMGLTSAARAAAGGGSGVTREFVGSSPFTDEIRAILGLPSDFSAEIIEWLLVLRGVTGESAPSYELLFSYGPSVPNIPGLGATKRTVRRTGNWSVRPHNLPVPGSLAYDLHGAVSLVELSADVLHVVAPDGRLLVGNAGWSFTLNRRRPPPPPASTAALEEARSITPLSTGPTVLAVFEGRTPGHEIVQLLGPGVRPSPKLKWRLTLFHDPRSRLPTTYKLEGTVYPRGPREGTWDVTPINGIPFYRLSAAGSSAPLHLLKADEGILYFATPAGSPLVGTENFSYALNLRR